MSYLAIYAQKLVLTLPLSICNQGRIYYPVVTSNTLVESFYKFLMIVLYIIYLVLIICLIFFTDGLSNVKSATVTGCSVSPCTLERGKNSTFNVNFVAGQYIYYFYLICYSVEVNLKDAHMVLDIT